MTHGEAWFKNKHKFYDPRTKFDDCETIYKGLPKRMSKEDILSYYNNKLHLYWKSINLNPKQKEPPMSQKKEKSKIQTRFDSIKDDEVLNITKAQLIDLVEKVKEETIKTHEKENQFNADELIHALETS